MLALLPSTQFSDDFPFLDQLRMFAGPPLGVALGPSGLLISFLGAERFQERGLEEDLEGEEERRQYGGCVVLRKG